MSIFDCFAKLEAERRAAAPVGAVTHLLVGLGNPGRDYLYTRHNAGFLCMDALAHTCDTFVEKARFHALVADTHFAGAHVLLMKPQTFMNCSGTAVREAADFYHIPPQNIIVFCDDINLEPGRLRARLSGTDGGHRGLRDIIEKCSADTFPRVRIGVGAKKDPAYSLADYVTGRFSDGELALLRTRFADAAHTAELLVRGDTEGAVAFCNANGGRGNAPGV